MDRGIDTATVAARTGISARRLGHWDRLGIISPSISPAQGSGSRRVYSQVDLAYVLLVNEVRLFGGTLELAKAVTEAVRGVAHQTGNLSKVRVVAAPSKIAYCGPNLDQWSSAIERAGGAMVYNMVTFVGEADSICSRPSQPSTEVVEVGGVAFQFVVAPRITRDVTDSFVATCNAYPRLSEVGSTPQSATAVLKKALKNAIESREGPAPDDVESSARTQQPAPGGASAWGGEW